MTPEAGAHGEIVRLGVSFERAAGRAGNLHEARGMDREAELHAAEPAPAERGLPVEGWLGSCGGRRSGMACWLWTHHKVSQHMDCNKGSILW